MGSEWNEISLGDLFKVKHGFAFKGKYFTEEPQKTVLVTPGNFAISGGFQKTKLKYYDGPIPSEYVLEPGQIIVTMTDLSKQSDSLGYAAVVPSDENTWLHNQRIGLLEFKDTYASDTFFVNYLLRSHEYRSWIIGSASGTTVKHTSPDRIESFTCMIPPLVEQRAIAHILGTLDDKLELNRKMNETLEAMAQALFRSWFVDFDPVIDNALEAGNAIPDAFEEKAAARKALGDKRIALPEDIRKLFPSAFDYSDEMGWVPKGWDVKSINDAIEINPTVKLKKNISATYVDMKALPTSGFSIAETIKKKYSGGAKFYNGDVLLARITPCLENGKTGAVDFLSENEVGFGSTEFIVLRKKGHLSTEFVACLSRMPHFRAHCIQSMVGSSGRQRVQNSCFSSIYLALPSNVEILNIFNKKTDLFFKKIKKQSEISNILSKLRDTLLPKLLSGELRIPEAEQLVKG